MNRPPLIRPLRSLLQGRLSIAAARPSQRHVLRQPALQLRANSSISKEPPIEKETSQQTSPAPEETPANVEKPAAKPEEATASPADATIEAMREEIRKLQAALLAKEATKPVPSVVEAPVQVVVEETKEPEAAVQPMAEETKTPEVEEVHGKAAPVVEAPLQAMVEETKEPEAAVQPLAEETKKPEVEEASAKPVPVAEAAVEAMVEETKTPEAEEVSAKPAPSAPQEADKLMAEETKKPETEEVATNTAPSAPQEADKPMPEEPKTPEAEEVSASTAPSAPQAADKSMAEETKKPEAAEVSANIAPSAPQAADKPTAEEPQTVDVEALADVHADAAFSATQAADRPVSEEPKKFEVEAEEVSTNTASSTPQAADKPMAEEPKTVDIEALADIYADAVSSLDEAADKPVPAELTKIEVEAEEVSANTATSAPQTADKPMAEEPKKLDAGAWGEKPKKLDAVAWGDIYAQATFNVAEAAAKAESEQAERLRAKTEQVERLRAKELFAAEEAAIRTESEEASGTTTPGEASSAIRRMAYEARALEAQDRAEAAELGVGVSRMPRSLEALYLRPLKRVAKYGLPVCDLQLRSYSVRPLEFFADFAVRAAYYLGLPASGPVPLPRKTQLWTVPKSHFVHKKSQENFSRITLRRLIQIKDGHPETVQIWLAFLQKHAYYGIGMKANVWEFSKADVAANMDAQVVELEKAMADKWPLMGVKGLTEEETEKGVSHPMMDPKKLEEFIAKERLDASGGR